MPSAFLPILLFLSIFLPFVSADECFTSGQIFGIVFGSVIGAFIISAGIGLALWYLHRKHEKTEKNLNFERAHQTDMTDSSMSSLAIDHSEKGILTDQNVVVRNRVSLRDKGTGVAMPTPLPRRKRGSSPSSPRSRSLNLLDSMNTDTLRRRHDQELALSRFGFSIERGDPESPLPSGIFVDKVIPGTPAELSGNIFSGDRIKTLTISFDDMTYDDALAILSLVSDYTIRLDLERVAKADETTQTDGDFQVHEETVVEIKLPLPVKSLSSFNVRKKLKCRHRKCESLEYLRAPALPRQKKKQRREEKKDLTECRCSMEEERVIRIVRHQPSRTRQPSEASSTGPSSDVPEGHALIRASDFHKRIQVNEVVESEMTATRGNPVIQELSPTTSTDSLSGAVVNVRDRQKTLIVSSEATVKISDSTHLELESVHLPQITPAPSPPLDPESSASQQLEAVVVQTERVSLQPKTEELMIDTQPTISLAVTSPKRPAAALTPDFVEVRAQKLSKEFGENIMDRKLPSLPPSSKDKNEKIDPGQMYLKVRNSLKEVYTETIETKKAALSSEQFNTLESNRRKLEKEKQQLRELGII